MIEHPYFTPGGPVTYEYPLPISEANCRQFPIWFQSLANQSAESVGQFLSDQWASLPKRFGPLTDYLRNQTPRSLACLPEWNAYWLVCESPDCQGPDFQDRGQMCFLPQPTSDVLCPWDETFDLFLKHFAGLKHSKKFPPSAGFMPPPLLNVREADTDLAWGPTGKWEHAIPFYSTGSGGQFVFSKSGEIAKWTFYSDSDTKFQEAYSDLESFLSSLVHYLQTPDRGSLFYA